MNKVAIIGPGLLGGSIALALRERDGMDVSVWARREESVREVLEGGFAAHASTQLREVVAGASLVILCTPVGSMAAIAGEMAPWLAPGAVVTDVGSVKAGVVAELTPIIGGDAFFVGSHPMAGSEKTGMQAARADLFEGAVCIVTPLSDSNSAALSTVISFWEMLGCRVRQCSPSAHDEYVAMVSHFPHLLAASLVNMVSEVCPEALELCGPGFRDTTRVAGGPPAMWTEILRTNRLAVRNSAEAMIEKLRKMLTLLDSGSPDEVMQEFLTQAKSQRDRLRLPR